MNIRVLNENKKTTINVSENTQYIIERGSYDFIFSKQGVLAEIIYIYSLKHKQKMMSEITIWHKAPNTSCSVQIKGILKDTSESTVFGKIIIDKKAFGTNSSISDSVLVLGNGTKRFSKPVLEINNNNVKALHDSSTGRVSEDEIYYLTSRGLSRPQAEELVVEGYVESLLSQIKDEKIRERVKGTL